ncbi:hypothetical protein CEE37_03645 [candidate division LCP-89 bacterium B3_LCP]|uniref:VanZ-like domain-containing protein n=1 Tax=candidate division LCP-89 bacterium B3_LCP TaxID=2012998 RepID=A0A532V3H1_UNCL8|nr:MAG: hypothetical protein CEE37_03645 [candidate division LCP-89 bacterium B3_LCP]
MTRSPSEQLVTRLNPVRLYIPLLVWLSVIFLLSTYSKAIIPQGKYISWDKLAHVVEFGILGYLAARTAYFKGSEWLRRNWFWVSVLFGILYAASDELHQYFVPGRFASEFDVLADSVGAIVGVLVFGKVITKKNK